MLSNLVNFKPGGWDNYIHQWWLIPLVARVSSLSGTHKVIIQSVNDIDCQKNQLKENI